ncbi:MAG: fibrobacter succinogenes major paralogous domain-containing protein [Bacteroidetes bacterium]|nr:fibrobacter succinogenes major paralogous domain-containing protein [Bacteroidota bacterium]
MKRTLIFLMLGFAFLTSVGQMPQAIKYQAITRGISGNILANQPISVRVNLLADSSLGTIVYSETHAITTNAYGLINLDIGKGTVVSGNFAAINWSSGTYFVKIEVDETGGNNFQFLGTSQLLAVPYAMYAKESGILRLTYEEIQAMVNPAEGLVIYNLTTGCLNVRRNDNWYALCGECYPQPTASLVAWVNDVKNDTVVLLQANTPQFGTGTWSVYEGEDGTFSGIHDPNAVFTGKLGQNYSLVWTISNTCGSSSYQIQVKLCPLLTQAQAGNDSTRIPGDHIVLNANEPGPLNQGVWECYANNVSFSDIHDPHATFTGLPGNNYYVYWYVNTNCESSIDELYLSFCPEVTIADAGPDQHVYGYFTYLEGNWPQYQNQGFWTILEGNNGFMEENTYCLSFFTGDYNTVYHLRWTTFTSCGDSSFDDVSISFCPPLTAADAGPDQTLTYGNYTLLAAVLPFDGYNGHWSLVSGTGGVFSDQASPTSGFTGQYNTSYVLRWTLTTICDTTYDEVTINLGSLFSCGETIDYLGQIYHIIQIGTQCWMKENLNAGTMINGSVADANNGTIEKYCYDNYPANCAVYGGLYSWDEMMQYTTTEGAQGICPAGWHIATDGEWTSLTDYLGGLSVAGGKMKETGTTHWYDPNTGATNESGFTALGGGYGSSAGTFYSLYFNAYFWSSTQTSSAGAYGYDLTYYNANAYRSSSNKTNRFSVRCLKDL